jgi:type I restriction-modification system DNA methylase subunit
VAKRKRQATRANTSAAKVGYEAQLWQMADALRGSMDAAEYKHVVLGLIFLKYISDAFEEQHAKLEAEKKQGADPEDELAFYDALETNDSAVKVLGDEKLRAIARELVETVRKNVTIDWTLRENVRAQLRVLVKRILKKHGYPPDKRERPRRRF